MQLFGIAAEPEAPAGGQLMTTAPVAGDVIAIVNGTNAMTGTASGKKLASETATVTDGVLALTDTLARLTVDIDANGYYIFTVDGKYLTSGATGNELKLTDAASEYSLWTVEAAGEGIFYIKSVNANYNGKPQSLEYYSGFTTYGHNTTAAYQMQLFKIGAGTVTPPDEPDTPDTPDTPDEPDVPVTGGANSADFDTIVPKSENGDSSYTNTYTTTNGWVTKNSAIQTGGATVMNPQYPVIGPDNTHKGVCMNGKTSAVGSITSPTLSGGISKLTLTYTKMFSDTKLSVTITVTDLATGNTYTRTVARDVASNDDKYVVWTDEWTLDTPVTGDFTIEIVNDCPSGATGNKDRMTVLDLSWEGAASEPDAPAGGQLMTTAPVAGDVIAIVNGTNAMTGTASGKKLAAEAATITDGVLTLTETLAQLTVSVDANGYYIFTVDGKYLTSGATGNELTLTDAASDYSLWTVEAAGEGIFYIKSVNANYNGKPQSLEYYSGFTTYGHNTTAAYQMQLFKIGAGAVTPPPVEEEKPEATEMTIAQARDAEEGTLVQVSGVVASITNAFGMKPDGVILVDDTASIYVYGGSLANQVAVGNTVTITATKTYYVLESEQSNATKFGYTGCNQLDDVTVVDLDTSVTDFSKSWIEETTVKDIMDTPVSEDITTLIYKVTAQVKKVEGTGFTNYYINDLDGVTGSYVYTKCSGSDFSWLDAFDGKICTVYLTALNAKSSASGCQWRFHPVEVKDEGFNAETVNFAENAVKFYGVPQFLPEYTGDPAKELLTSADNALLGYTGAKLSYTSSDPSVVSIDENVLHCHKTGTAVITVTGEHNGVTYSEEVTIKVDIFDVNAEYPTVADAVAADLDSVVTVKGVVGPSLVNKSGFYLIDDTGVIAVLVDEATLATLEIGYEVVLEASREYHAKSGTRGNSCLNNTKVLYNGYGNHAYSTASFDGELTLAEFAALSVDTDYTTSVYTVTATVEVVETAYYTSIKLVDGDVSVNLYSASAAQYSWLQEYAGQEITMELAPCNWSSKAVYPACVLAVVHGDGSKTVNTLNFD